jgi:hypothetical protein
MEPSDAFEREKSEIWIVVSERASWKRIGGRRGRRKGRGEGRQRWWWKWTVK